MSECGKFILYIVIQYIVGLYICIYTLWAQSRSEVEHSIRVNVITIGTVLSVVFSTRLAEPNTLNVKGARKQPHLLSQIGQFDVHNLTLLTLLDLLRGVIVVLSHFVRKYLLVGLCIFYKKYSNLLLGIFEKENL